MFDAQSTSMVVSRREEEQEEEGKQQRHQLTLLCSILLVGINLCGTYYGFVGVHGLFSKECPSGPKTTTKRNKKVVATHRKQAQQSSKGNSHVDVETNRKGGQKCQHRRHHHTDSEKTLGAESFRDHSAEEWGDDITVEIRRQYHPLHVDRNVVRVVYLTRRCLSSITYILFLSIMQISIVKALKEVEFSDLTLKG